MIEQPVADLYPTGIARGWRRTGCLAMLVGGLLLIALAVW
jgi:hypothetical protein